MFLRDLYASGPHLDDDDDDLGRSLPPRVALVDVAVVTFVSFQNKSCLALNK